MVNFWSGIGAGAGAVSREERVSRPRCLKRRDLTTAIGSTAAPEAFTIQEGSEQRLTPLERFGQ